MGIAVTAGGITAVTMRSAGEAEPVLVDGWPTQAIDATDDDAIAQALQRLRSQVWHDIDAVVVTYPASFSAARTHRLRKQVMDAGWPEVRMVSIPVTVAFAFPDGYWPGAMVMVDATGSRGEVAVLRPQPECESGYVASRVTEQTGQGLAATVTAAVTAADLKVTDIKRVVVAGAASTDHELSKALSGAGLPDAAMVSSVQLAADGLRADTEIGGGRPRHVTRYRGWPRPVSSLACAVAGLAALIAVTSSAGTSGAQPDTVTFALGCLGLVTAVQGVTSFLAARSVSYRAGASGWVRAGRFLLIGSAVGAGAVVVAVVVVASVFGTSPWPLILAGGSAVVVVLAASATIAVGIAWHPDQPPKRALWPPVGAMTAVSSAAILVHNTTSVTAPATGLEALPMRLGVGVWVFAIGGMVIAAPWPRVVVGLAAGVAAGLVVTAATVPVFAVVVVAVVSGWWLVTATLVAYDRHGLPDVHLGSRARTVN